MSKIKEKVMNNNKFLLRENIACKKSFRSLTPVIR